MLIIDRDEFMRMPVGIVYHKYEPNAFEGIYVKGETLKDGDRNIDWCETQLDVPYFAYCSSSNLEAEESMLEGGVEHAEYCSGREGWFHYDQMFAVLSKSEVVKIIDILNSAIVQGYK